MPFNLDGNSELFSFSGSLFHWQSLHFTVLSPLVATGCHCSVYSSFQWKSRSFAQMIVVNVGIRLKALLLLLYTERSAGPTTWPIWLGSAEIFVKEWSIMLCPTSSWPHTIMLKLLTVNGQQGCYIEPLSFTLHVPLSEIDTCYICYLIECLNAWVSAEKQRTRGSVFNYILWVKWVLIPQAPQLQWCML